MSDNDRIRIEIAFDQQVLSVLVPSSRRRARPGPGLGQDPTFSFEADDGRYTILLRRVVYVKRSRARAASASAPPPEPGLRDPGARARTDKDVRGGPPRRRRARRSVFARSSTGRSMATGRRSRSCT